MKEVKSISVYTDGGSRNHGNIKGGHVKSTDSAAWAYLIQYPNGVVIKQTGYEQGKTNNQEELRGVIEALSTLCNRGVVHLSKPHVDLYTDSKYIYNAFKLGWVTKWQKKNFKKVKNAERWRVLLYMVAHIADLRFHWVKGHAESNGNNFVDKLLNAKMDQVEATKKARRNNKSKEKVTE